MEGAIIATAGVLFVGTLSGLSFLAIHYPKTFNNIGAIGALAFIILTVASLGYAYGAHYAAEAAMPFIPQPKVKDALAAINNVLLAPWASWAMMIFALAMVGLHFVSKLVDSEKKEIQGTGEDGK